MSKQDLEELEEVFTELTIFKGIDLYDGVLSEKIRKDPLVQNTNLFKKIPYDVTTYLYYKLRNSTNPTDFTLRREFHFQDVILKY